MPFDKNWYYKVTADWTELPACLEYFSSEADEACKELSLKGRLEDHASKLPVITERRFAQLQVLNAIVRAFEIERDKLKAHHYKKFLENYDKKLTSRDAEKYAEAEADVVDLELLINEICMVRNLFTGIIKGLDGKSYTINNISKLRTAGLENSTLE
jgi:hypothetical protein